MKTIAVAVFLAAASVGAPAAVHAAPTFAPAPAMHNPSVILAQWWNHWWEHEHVQQQARQRYWDLPPDRRDRYNELQARIDQLQRRRHEIDARIREAVGEQHRLLGFRDRYDR